MYKYSTYNFKILKRLDTFDLKKLSLDIFFFFSLEFSNFFGSPLHFFNPMVINEPFTSCGTGWYSIIHRIKMGIK